MGRYIGGYGPRWVRVYIYSRAALYRREAPMHAAMPWRSASGTSLPTLMKPTTLTLTLYAFIMSSASSVQTVRVTRKSSEPCIGGASSTSRLNSYPIGFRALMSEIAEASAITSTSVKKWAEISTGGFLVFLISICNPCARQPMDAVARRYCFGYSSVEGWFSASVRAGLGTTLLFRFLSRGWAFPTRRDLYRLWCGPQSHVLCAVLF